MYERQSSELQLPSDFTTGNGNGERRSPSHVKRMNWVNQVEEVDQFVKRTSYPQLLDRATLVKSRTKPQDNLMLSAEKSMLLMLMLMSKIPLSTQNHPPSQLNC